MTAELKCGRARENAPSASATRPKSCLLGLLGNVARRQRGPLAEEKIFHVFGYEILRLFLPRHQAILVQDHLHPLFPELPRILRDALVDALPELAGPGRSVEAGQLLLEFHAHDLATARV